MRTVLAYCPDVTVLRQKIEELEAAGRYKQHLLRDYPVEGESHVVVTGASSKCPVQWVNEASNESLCLFAIQPRDVVGDAEDPDYVPFLDAAGLQGLAYGINRGGEQCPYHLVQQDPVALEIYERFYPQRQDTDEEGNPLGDPYFNKGVELAT